MSDDGHTDVVFEITLEQNLDLLASEDTEYYCLYWLFNPEDWEDWKLHLEELRLEGLKLQREFIASSLKFMHKWEGNR